MTTQPAAAARGLCTAETLAPGEDRAMSTPLKSKLARSWTLRTLSSPKETSLPGRTLGGERDHIVDGKFAVRQCLQHLAADISRGTYHCNSVAHGNPLTFPFVAAARPSGDWGGAKRT